MAWGDIDLSEVDNGDLVLPEDTNYNFALVSAKVNNFDTEKVDVVAKVLDGPYDKKFVGKVVYFSYPDPHKYEWSTQLVAKLAKQMKIPFDKGENVITYFNRASKAGGSFMAPVKHRVVEVDGLPETRSELNIFGVKRIK